ncbi:MAG: hypothetical protein JW772_03315 [Candidatus Diapherotrites archaeon]|nr:hypothetical protein [Candidatus Diapherotrites archaeon]
MKKIIPILLIAIILALAGCVQTTMDELGTCMAKCGEACQVLKNNDFDFEGYSIVGLQKQSGGMTVECSCPC